MTEHEFLFVLADRADSYPSARAAARAWGVSQPYLAAVLKYRSRPGPKLVAAVGYRRVVSYEPVTEETTV